MVGKEISLPEEIQPNHSNSNRSGSRCHGDNTVDSNRNVENRLSDKKLWLNSFESFE